MIHQPPDKIKRAAERFMAILQEEDAVGEWDAVGVVAIVAEVRQFAETPGEGTANFIYYCTDSRPWVQSAVLREALEVAEDQRYFDFELDDEEDEDG